MPSRYKLTYLFFTFLLAVVLASSAFAQQPGPVQYIYDALGRLVKVIDAAGNVAEYVYDPVGNILEIQRSTISSLAVFDFAPQRGAVGTTVTIQGQGFSTSPSGNLVLFNGAAAAVISATATSLVVTVPPGATTGPVAVTVSGNTATSSSNFTVLPLITAINPALAVSESTITGLQVQGSNLLDSTFTFTPEFTPPAVTVTSASIDLSGASATLNVTVGANASGSFVLVATNASGSSSPVSSVANILTVIGGAADADHDGLANADELQRGTDPFKGDTDGDKLGDGEEVSAGSNPLDPNSLPFDPNQSIGETASGTISVLNTFAPPVATFPQEAASKTVSVLNTTPAPQADFLREAESPVFSIKNDASP